MKRISENINSNRVSVNIKLKRISENINSNRVSVNIKLKRVSDNTKKYSVKKQLYLIFESTEICFQAIYSGKPAVGWERSVVGGGGGGVDKK